MTAYAFEHIHLRSPNPDATADWFGRMFGAEFYALEQRDYFPRIWSPVGFASDLQLIRIDRGHDSVHS